MYVFYISDSEVKNFMNKILRENYFDDFELRNVQIKSFAKFDIDGKIERKFCENNNDFSDDIFFCKWKKIKPYVFNFIKGKVKPSYMKIVISAPENLLQQISENAAALFLNFVFENDKVCTTGVSQKNFQLNKKLDLAWEEYVRSFFKNIQITTYEQN